MEILVDDLEVFEISFVRGDDEVGRFYPPLLLSKVGKRISPPDYMHWPWLPTGSLYESPVYDFNAVQDEGRLERIQDHFRVMTFIEQEGHYGAWVG